MDPLGPYAPLLFKDLWGSNFNDLVKVAGMMVSFVGASGRTPIFGRASVRPYNARRAKTEE